ncbi:hypothetical protein BAY10_14355 [Elizabethkingia anophelis]|nr:hypothetical protein AYC67_01935 [Elizabethkingia anophelis]MDV3942257.1 hypothetical protein [Elizabethkingia anophelis]OPB55553.1 hypothetical protein BAY10_14355 [Elizabethkingia anophelis]OPC08702.1 hypothetical protein BAY01_14860 [Elizabethkingia miricola]
MKLLMLVVLKNSSVGSVLSALGSIFNPIEGTARTIVDIECLEADSKTRPTTKFTTFKIINY